MPILSILQELQKIETHFRCLDFVKLDEPYQKIKNKIKKLKGIEKPNSSSELKTAMAAILHKTHVHERKQFAPSRL